MEYFAKVLGAGVAFMPLLFAVSLMGVAGFAMHYRKYKDYREG